jgi:hypothetical protein
MGAYTIADDQLALSAGWDERSRACTRNPQNTQNSFLNAIAENCLDCLLANEI